MSQSTHLFNRAKQCIPGGVNSPVRAFNGVEGRHPIFFKKGQGAFVYDVDDKEYIDYVGSWGPLVLGHSDPEVVRAVTEVVRSGMSYGAPTEVEVQLAELVQALMPSIDKIRMVNSGTEATMSAIRLARGFTGRDKIIKFEGCYHGHCDSLLVAAGSGALTLGVPSSPGVPSSVVADTLVVPFNDLEALKAAFSTHGDQIAAIIVEPIAANMNFVPPKPGFLQALRKLCDDHESLLIFDEVMTGFRLHSGGAQAYYGITPDLSTLGKIIGGGMPVGAYGGRADIMAMVAPEGPVYQAGTLSGNPMAMTAGLVTLNRLKQPGFHQALAETTQNLVSGLQSLASDYQVPMSVKQVPGMFGLLFTSEQDISCLQHVEKSDLKRFHQFYHGLLDEGIYLGPSMYEVGFVSSAHDDATTTRTLEAVDRIFKQWARTS